MRWHLAVAALVGLAVTLSTRCVAAQGETSWSTDVAPGATNPNKIGESVAVVFDGSATGLPQADIRAAIARELRNAPDKTVVAASRVLLVSVAEQELVVRFESREGLTERRLPLPAERAEIPELLSLLAVNLVHDQRALLGDGAAPRTAPAPVATPALVTGAAPIVDPWTAGAPHRVPLARHWVGLHVAQDFLYHPFTGVCNVTPAQDPTYTCYERGSGQIYDASGHSTYRSVYSGVSVATTRLLLSYDYAIREWATLGVRAGYAFGGGPPEADTRFLPLHFELRATYWYAPLTNARLRAYVGGSGGVMQIDAKVRNVGTCSLDAGLTATTDGCGSVWTDGTTTRAGVTLDSWKKVGAGFVGLHTGASVHFAGSFSLSANVNVIATLPAFGFALEPSLGVVSAL